MLVLAYDVRLLKRKERYCDVSQETDRTIVN